MEKANIYPTRLWIYASMLSLLLGAACSSPRISQLHQPAMQEPAAKSYAKDGKQLQTVILPAEQAVNEAMPDDYLLASASTDNTVAAAATRPASNIVLPSRKVNKASAPAQTQPAFTKDKNTDHKRNITRTLSLPAKMMLKSIVKKAKKIEKKLDIKQANKAEDVNNTKFLIVGIILAAAGLALIIAGNTTLLYILGTGASLAGLVFLLLALL